MTLVFTTHTRCEQEALRYHSMVSKRKLEEFELYVQHESGNLLSVISCCSSVSMASLLLRLSLSTLCLTSHCSSISVASLFACALFIAHIQCHCPILVWPLVAPLSVWLHLNHFTYLCSSGSAATNSLFSIHCLFSLSILYWSLGSLFSSVWDLGYMNLSL